MNILSNSIDAIEEKGEEAGENHVIIKTYTEEDKIFRFVVVEVRDSGKGVPEAMMKKVFDPFFTTKPVGKGLGLGLSISNNIIREHGGKIELTNNNGGGVTFKISLPINTQGHE